MCKDADRLAEPPTPRVSVVMATFNYGVFIAQAIQSVVDQTYTDWELIIIDDGSTDCTPDEVRRFVADPRIHYYWQKNRGQPQAKNAGIRLARGQLIAFLDADDAWAREKLLKQVMLFDGDPDLGVAYTGRRMMDPNGSISGDPDDQMVRGYVLDVALKRTIPPFSSCVLRRAVFDDVGLFDESIPLAIDYELWLRVAVKYRFDYVDEPLLLYRTGHANLSTRFRERRAIVLETIMPRFLNDYGGRRHLSFRVIAEAYADTYLNTAESLRSISKVKALWWHLRSLVTAPWLIAAWRSSVKTLLPQRLFLLLRSLRRSSTPRSRKAWRGTAN